MEPPVTSSRGPMSSLLRKLDSILECQQLLRNPVREDFELLKEDLAGIDTFLLEISDEDDPNLVKKYWMKEVREICYDADDFIDWLIHSAQAKIWSVGVVPRLKISQLPSRTRTPRPRLKISRLPRTLNPDPRPNIASQIKELRARLEDARERHKRYALDNNTAYSSSSSVHSRTHWEWYREAVSILVGIDDSKKILINLLNNGEKKLNVISISGLGGIGKTTLAKQILQELGWQFGCHAFVRASRKPDTRSLLRSILTQTGWRHHSEACNLQQLIDHLREHLRHRRFLIVIDDLWDISVWDFLLRAFPDGTQSSRIITTTTSENVATTCCGNRSDYILKMEPLNDDDSRKIFFARVFGSENKCPQQFKDASYEIVQKCGGVPLAVIHIAGLLTCQQDRSEEWDYVERSLGSNLSITPTYEGMRKVINLSYNGLPQCLKTCLQYVCMYPENCTIWKDDLVRRWVAEGFIEGDSEVISQSHFEELVYRGMIHPTDIDYNEQVLSCTVHHMVLDFVRNKSAEDNFVTTVDYSQNTGELSSKVRRLFLFYSTAKYAAKLLGITLLQVRSVAFYGLVKCLPSIQEFKFLRVLFLHLWGNYNDSTILNLSGINKLFQLRYLKVTCNYCLQLPTNMGGLHRLETLEIDAIVTSVPEDIIQLKYLVHLSLPQETKLPYEVGRLRSLRTLKCFDFCGNSDDEVKSLQELSCLEELQLVLTTEPSGSVDRNLKVLFSILGCLYKLKSLVIVRGASVSKDSIIIIDSNSTSCPKDCLERLELHRGTCILCSLPKWIGQLGSLCILKLGVLEILKNDVDSFAGLQVLKFLSLYVRRPTAEPIIISSWAFPALEHFKFKSGVLCIAFRPGAMPKLHRLKLSFNAYSGVEFGRNMIVGIEHLLNLQEVSGRIGAAVGSKESDKTTAESKLKNAISKHSMIPRLNIQVVDWIEEDRVPPGDIMPSKMQINKLAGDHGFLGGKSDVNTIKVDECRTSSLFLDAVVTSSDVLNSDDKRKKSYVVDVSKSTGRRLSATNIMPSYSDKSFYGKDRIKVYTLKNMGGMEAALVCTMLKIVGTKLAPLVIKEFSSIAGVTKDLEEFQGLVDEINIWLQTVGKKAMRNDQSSSWLKKLKDATYDAEDLVNEFHIEAEKLDLGVGVNNVAIKYLWTKPKSVMFEYKTTHKIKAMKKRFDVIMKQRSDYSTIANSMPVDNPVQYTTKTIGEVPLWPIVDDTSIFVRDQEKNLLISELIETNDQQRIKIVSIIGLGGSGKTTLAKQVFNDINIINKHFEVLLWVHVSREFAVEKLVEKLFEAITYDKPTEFSPHHVSRTISDKLAGKKFLAVLDDVWTEDRVDWERFMVHLKSGALGSSILLTTRSRKVTEAVDSTYTYDLPFLSEEESWKVFQKCFGIASKGLDPEFEQVGKEIVNKCGGVPLAVEVLAGVLHGMKGIEEWQSIRDSNLLDVEDEEHRVFACLWLSYSYLPDHLKPCFIHCSIFPRGYLINRRHLISQWIAHGFILTNRAQQPEDVGIGYFDSLMQVGFLQDREQYLYGSEVTCKMHDLIHDLARQILQDEFVGGIATTSQIKMCRYLSLTSWPGEVDKKLFAKVRALYVSGRNLAFDKTINKQCCVRTIILKYISVDSLPLFASKFEHVGYFEICHVNCEALPEAISQCWNLQAIHVIKCTRLAILPGSIGKLKKLRTLEVNTAWNIRSLPQSIGDCDNLQSLYLQDCGIKDMPNSMGKMVNLRVLSIVGCTSLRQLPESFGNLCHLRTITLHGCWDLQHLPQCITSLSHLEFVDLHCCRKLVELPEGIGNLKHLKVLNLKGCNKLCGLPACFGNLTRLQQLGLFVIGNSTKHAGISELENLKKLNGELKIKNIKYVKDPDDAERVRLMEKSGIRKLSFDWYEKGELQTSDNVEENFAAARTEDELSLDMEKDMHLLNCLEPPSEIENLKISGYRGPQLPHWMMKKNGSRDLSDIHMLKPRSTPQFPHLTNLVLKNLPNLEHLRELLDLTGIKVLKLRGMPKLAELLTTTSSLANGDEGVEVQYCFPCLHDLVISDCPKLIVKPYFPLSLQSLTLEGSNEQLLSAGCFFHPHHAVHASGNKASPSLCIADVKPRHITQLKLGRMMKSSSGWEVLQHLTGLYDLEIADCQDLKQLPESMRGLTCLRRLGLNHCNNLCMLPEWFGELQSLQSLDIRHLPAMSVFPESMKRLTSLRSLAIVVCDALRQLPEQLGELCSLDVLEIWRLPALTQLPESMRRLTSLRYLNLGCCDALTQLPESLGELSALRRLVIHSCRGLTSLPCFIGRLTTLEKLMISNCPELVRRCKEGVGEDWYLVSHIPDLELRG